MNLEKSKILLGGLALVLVGLAFWAGTQFSTQPVPSSALELDETPDEQLSTDQNRRELAAKVITDPNTKITCDPQQTPYLNMVVKDFILTYTTTQISVVSGADVFKEGCQLLQQLGVARLENVITFVNDDPYFDGYATLIVPEETVYAATSTYSYNINKTYLIAFSFSRGQERGTMAINQIGVLAAVQSVESLSILSIPGIPTMLGIRGMDAAGNSIREYLRVAPVKHSGAGFAPQRYADLY